MAAGSWAMACVWLTLGQAPADVLVTNQRSLSIPVNIQEARKAEVRELLLFASTDQGRNWQQVAAMLPTQTAFTFTAPIDGTYWLRVAAINRDNKQEPENLSQGQPDQRMVIDTMKPLLRLGTPQRQGDEISIAWELREDNPEWGSFRLEYQPKDGSSLVWTPIQATAGLTGQARFRPSTPGMVAVRLSFTDKAGNQAFTGVDAPGTVLAAGFNNPSGPLPAPMFPGAPAPVPTPASNPPAAQVALPPPLTQPGNLAEAPKLPPLPGIEPPKTFPMNPPPPVWNASAAGKTEPGKVVATTEAPLATVTQAATPAAPPQRTLPPLRYVNHPEVTLEYELNRVGPSGVGTIELWWTRNDGQSWEHAADDPEGKSGTLANGKHKRTIELPGDGVYGFNLVVKSKAGLGKAPPRAGEVPDIRVELDTSSPVAQLYSPAPDPQKANTLQLKWTARDNNLTGTPVMLEWAAKRDGPWQAIAPPLPNTGKHHWQLPDGLPVQVYLRLRCRDVAGNESVAVTAEPQLVDLSEPEGRLINVSVSPR